MRLVKRRNTEEEGSEWIERREWCVSEVWWTKLKLETSLGIV